MSGTKIHLLHYVVKHRDPKNNSLLTPYRMCYDDAHAFAIRHDGLVTNCDEYFKRYGIDLRAGPEALQILTPETNA